MDKKLMKKITFQLNTNAYKEYSHQWELVGKLLYDRDKSLLNKYRKTHYQIHCERELLHGHITASNFKYFYSYPLQWHVLDIHIAIPRYL